ncbi:MAG: hypothetical protein P4L90_21300 [Rhodopila sp.]|nr:hypothetical protein [Rhodopila sp.]
MTWLSENWIWVALAVGALLLMTRMHGMGGGGGCCGGHQQTQDESTRNGHHTAH